MWKTIENNFKKIVLLSIIVFGIILSVCSVVITNRFILISKQDSSSVIFYKSDDSSSSYNFKVNKSEISEISDKKELDKNWVEVRYYNGSKYWYNCHIVSYSFLFKIKNIFIEYGYSKYSEESNYNDPGYPKELIKYDSKNIMLLDVEMTKELLKTKRTDMSIPHGYFYKNSKNDYINGKGWKFIENKIQ